MTEPRTEKHRAMMTRGRACAVLIRASDGRESSGEVRLQFWDRRARLRRGLKFLGLAWGFALVSLFIPIAHFLLVPSFLLAGPLGAWRVSRRERSILGGEGLCPACGVFLPIIGGAERWPVSDLCSACQTALTITRK